jgi:2-polyprenyl-6-methoxyphenol hydroxylase-like FAD-dependent oxidoreductase
MFDVLRHALPDACYRAGAVVEEVFSFPGYSEVTLSDGTRLQADLVVAADGFR